MKKNISRIIGVIMFDCSYCIYSVSIESSRKEFPLEQYNYWVTVWYIFSCDSGAAYCS